MRSLLAVASVLSAAGVFVAVANCQQDTLTATEYELVVKSAEAASAKHIRRVTSESETRTRGRVTSKSYHVEEYIPTELERFVDTVSSGEKSTTEEIIQIGRFGYQRKEKGPWVEWTGRPPRVLRPGTYTICGEYLAEVCSYISLESQQLDGHITRLISRNGEKDVNGLPVTEVTRLWISGDGRLMKTEVVVTEGKAKEWEKRTTSTWEYDPPGLEIKQPIN